MKRSLLYYAIAHVLLCMKIEFMSNKEKTDATGTE